MINDKSQNMDYTGWFLFSTQLINIAIFQGEAHHDLVRDVRQNKGSILKVKRIIRNIVLCCLTTLMLTTVDCVV